MRKWGKFMQSLLLAIVILCKETILKRYREEKPDSKEYLGGNVRVITYHNYGAFLNLGEKNPFIVKAVSVIFTFMISILFILTFTRFGNKELRTGLAFLLGGAYSNTYDRVKKGYVTDYLNFPKLPGKSRNAVFNISDFCILIGCCLILIKQK